MTPQPENHKCNWFVVYVIITKMVRGSKYNTIDTSIQTNLYVCMYVCMYV